MVSNRVDYTTTELKLSLDIDLEKKIRMKLRAA